MKTFQALTMADALRAIKEELGPDAVILSSRQVKSGDGMFGMFGRTMVEVVAADDTRSAGRPAARPAAPPAQPSPATFESALYSSLREPTSETGSGRPSAGAGMTERQWSRLSAELRDLRQLVERSVRERHAVPPAAPRRADTLPPRLTKLYYELVNNDVEPELAESLIRTLQADPASSTEHEPTLRRALSRVIAAGVPVSGPLLPASQMKKTAVFVGPTGVGKTTTIAKIAAHYKLKQNRSVAMITLDTYRVAAVEQLRLYANIIGVSLDVALTKREALDFIRRRSKHDLILLDTTGRSPMDATGVEELEELLELDHPLETHLVMAATTRERDLMDAMSRYAALPIKHLLFTKLDETTSYGHLYTMARRTGLSLSYFSVGQCVPEDIEEVTADRIGDLVLGAPLRASGLRPGRPTTAADVSRTLPAREPAYRTLQPSMPVAATAAPRPAATAAASTTARPATASPRPAAVARKAVTRSVRQTFTTRLGVWLGFGSGGNR